MMTKNNTTYARVNGLRTENITKISSITQSGLGIIPNRPSYRKGSLAAQIISYMRSTKSPRSARNITEQLMKKRDYSSYNSAQRAVASEILRLSNWGILDIAPSRREGSRGKLSTTFTLNSDLRHN